MSHCMYKQYRLQHRCIVPDNATHSAELSLASPILMWHCALYKEQLYIKRLSMNKIRHHIFMTVHEAQDLEFLLQQ